VACGLALASSIACFTPAPVPPGPAGPPGPGAAGPGQCPVGCQAALDSVFTQCAADLSPLQLVVVTTGIQLLSPFADACNICPRRLCNANRCTIGFAKFIFAAAVQGGCTAPPPGTKDGCPAACATALGFVGDACTENSCVSDPIVVGPTINSVPCFLDAFLLITGSGCASPIASDGLFDDCTFFQCPDQGLNMCELHPNLGLTSVGDKCCSQVRNLLIDTAPDILSTPISCPPTEFDGSDGCLEVRDYLTGKTCSAAEKCTSIALFAGFFNQHHTESCPLQVTCGFNIATELANACNPVPPPPPPPGMGMDMGMN